MDITALDMSDLLVITDVFLLASGTSRRHVRTLVAAVDEALRNGTGRRPLRREGLEGARWVVLDYGDLVLHVFDAETRAYYDLERLWVDAPRIDVGSVVAEA